MACSILPLAVPAANLVALEYFRGRHLEDAINCSQMLTDLLRKDNTDTHLSNGTCAIHPQMMLDLFCKQCGVDVCRVCTGATTHIRHEYTALSDKINEETHKLGKVTDSVIELLEEMKRAMSGVKEMKQRVRKRKDNNINMTREVFATLRKAIDEREEQTIGDIKEAAYKREKALELQLQKLVLLWTQVKNCSELIGKTTKKKMRSEEFTKRRTILERRSGHLKEMIKQSRLKPVASEQAEPEFENIEELCQSIRKLPFVPVEPSKCKVVIPPVIVKKKTTLMIMLKNKNNNPVGDCCKELNVFIENIRDGKAIQVRAIREVGDGRYEASFTATRCGYYMVSIIVDGHHIPGSPYRVFFNRNYHKISEQDCSQMVTHFGENKFGYLNDVAIAPSGEIVIVDDGNKCVVVLDNKLNLLKVIGQGSGNSRLVSPDGVAVTGDVIAVSDYSSDQVKKYSLQGELLSVIGCPGQKNGQFRYPRGLAFNKNKMLHVVDGGNYRIQVFQQDDTFGFSFGNKESDPKKLQFPVRIATDSNDNVLVTDCFTNCILIFSHSGQFIQTVHCHSLFAIIVNPMGYLITSHGGDYNKIRVWSPTYQLISQFGRTGSQQGEFHGIRGMAIDSSGIVYVVEFTNHRLQIICSD